MNALKNNNDRLGKHNDPGLLPSSDVHAGHNQLLHTGAHEIKQPHKASWVTAVGILPSSKGNEREGRERETQISTQANVVVEAERNSQGWT